MAGWEKAGRMATQATTVLCAAILFVMMMLTIVDVLLRYVFSSPLPGAYELTELCLAMLIYAGLPLVSLRSLHVSTDFFESLLSDRMRRALQALINLTCGGTLVAVARVIWDKADTIRRAGDVTQVLSISLWPFVYIMAVLIFATALIHFGRMLVPVARESRGPEARQRDAAGPGTGGA